jgi:hypothetical protein
LEHKVKMDCTPDAVLALLELAQDISEIEGNGHVFGVALIK